MEVMMSWTGMLALAAAQAAPIDRDLLAIDDLRWRAVHDTVMGGRSSGDVLPTQDGLRFSGRLSLENNGGFASIRGQSDQFDLGGTDGLQLEVVGDGRTWFVTVDRADVRLRAGSYRTAIQTREGESTTHNLRWSDFQPTSFGRPVVGVPALQAAPGRIAQIGLMVADGQEGSFDVEVLSLRPLAESSVLPEAEEVPTEAVAGLSSTFARAIEVGVPAFNRGDAGRCRAHYQTAIESVLLLSPDELTEDEAQLLRNSLQQAAVEADVDAAWTLRRAMDSLLVATAAR
jgi:monofunctional biosynthetic peptidoglycan transglycosylase